MTEIKTFFIKTYGCQMNELDSEMIATQFKQAGLAPAACEQQADVLLFNTCSVRDLAERKIMGKLGTLQRKKKKQIIGVAGCMVMAKKEKLLKKFPFIDFLIGTNNIADVKEAITALIQKNQPTYKYSDAYDHKIDSIFPERKNRYKAYLSIIRGCDKFCTYCVVPHTRGREVSRSKESVLLECQKLADLGYKEIFLLGQNVNSYGKDFKEKHYLFHDLLSDINAIDGIERIRFMTSHPVDITQNLMQAVKDLKKVCEFIHFPLQSGSNSILKKMNRRYTKEEYLEKILQFKSIVPNISFGTDIIVGFPTETDSDFEETKQMFEKIRFSHAFIFAYSPRKNTAAINMPDDISKEIKDKRLQELLSLYKGLSAKRLQNLENSIQNVLFEKYYPEDNTYRGKTRHFDKVVVKNISSNLLGTTQNVKIEKNSFETLIGSIV